MINLPKKCIVNRFIPKNKFYEKLAISSLVKEEFINEVEKITWVYKISEDTLTISKTKNVEEIEIFEIRVKERKIPKNVIKVVSKSIPYKILFVIKYQEEQCYGIAVSDIYYSDWNEEIEFDFTGVNLEVIYESIVKSIIKETDNSSDFDVVIANKAKLEELNKKIESLARKIKIEKQFNRKVALNQELQKVIAEREELENGQTKNGVYEYN